MESNQNVESKPKNVESKTEKCGVKNSIFKKSVILSLNSSHSIHYSLIVLSDSEYCFCTKFGQLILRKIIKNVATRCQILRPKCTTIQFRLGLRPRPRWRAYSAPPGPLAGFKGPTSKGRGREERGERGREGREVDTPRFLLGSSPI